MERKSLACWRWWAGWLWMSLQRYQLSAFLLPSQLAGRNGSSGIRSWSQGNRSLPRNARRIEAAVETLPFRLRHRKEQLGKDLCHLSVASSMLHRGPFAKTLTASWVLPLQTKGAHCYLFTGACCVNYYTSAWSLPDTGSSFLYEKHELRVIWIPPNKEEA